MFEPPTVAHQLKAGFKTVTAWCEGRRCSHHGDIPLAGRPLTCRSLISASPLSINVSELYDRSSGGDNHQDT